MSQELLLKKQTPLTEVSGESLIWYVNEDLSIRGLWPGRERDRVDHG